MQGLKWLGDAPTAFLSSCSFRKSPWKVKSHVWIKKRPKRLYSQKIIQFLKKIGKFEAEQPNILETCSKQSLIFLLPNATTYRPVLH